MMKPVTARLSAMMFLQFFIWGAWYVPAASYMTKIGLDASIGWVYTVGPIAALISPLFLGLVADRYFASDRVLAVLQLLGGLALLFAPIVGDWSADAWAVAAAEMTAAGQDPAAYASSVMIIPQHIPFVGLILLHMLFYMPTLGLTNTLTFHNIHDQEKEFPVIRVFGTIGWIVANWAVSLMGADESSLPLYLAGGSALAMGVYSFSLPHTPPPSKGKKASLRESLGMDALRLMKEPSYAVFIVCSMLICIPLAGYYSFAALFVNHSGFHLVAGIMSLGQISEIIFMLLMPLFFARLGVKWMLAVGMLAWVVRYGLFAASGDDAVKWMILMGVILHGICYDFFFVTGFIYTDKKCRPEIRGQAQGFLVLVTQGIGLGLGAQIMQRFIVNRNKSDQYDALIERGNALRAEHDELVQQMEQAPEASASFRQQIDNVWQQASETFLQAQDWRSIWLVTCIMAAVILVAFVLLFKNGKSAGKSIDMGDVGEAATIDEQP